MKINTTIIKDLKFNIIIKENEDIFTKTFIVSDNENNLFKLYFNEIDIKNIDNIDKCMNKFKNNNIKYLEEIINYFFYENDIMSLFLVIQTKFDKDDKSISKMYKDNNINSINMLYHLYELFTVINDINDKYEIALFNINPNNIIITKDNNIILTLYWISTIYDLNEIILKQVTNTDYSRYLSPELWKGFIQSSLSNEYRKIYKVDVFSTILIFYNIFNKNNDNNLTISKMMAFDKNFEYDKYFKNTNNEWFDRLCLRTITLTYQERANVFEIKGYLEDIRNSQSDLIKKQDNEKNNDMINYENEKIKNKEIEFYENNNENNNKENDNKEDNKEENDKNENNNNSYNSNNNSNNSNNNTCYYNNYNNINNISKEINNISYDYLYNYEFERIESKFKIYFKSRNISEKLLILLIGKRFKKEYNNVKVIEFDNNKISTMDDFPIIENFVNNFDNLKFLLLNIDDDENVLLKINKAFNYVTKLVSTNKDKIFILHTYWSIYQNEALTKYCNKQLELSKEYNNLIYVCSGGNQGFNFNENDYNSNHSRFPICFKNDIKITVGSINFKSQKISNSSNRGYFIDYYSNGKESTIDSSLNVLLSVALIWSFYSKSNSLSILKKLNDLSNRRIIDFKSILKHVEKEYIIEEFSLNTRINNNHNQNVYLNNFSFNFNLLLLNNTRIFNKISYIPTSLRLEFSIKNIQYDIKIVNNKVKDDLFEQFIEFRKSNEFGKKIIINDENENYKINYNLNEIITYNFEFSNEYIKIKIGENNNFIKKFNDNDKFDILRIENILIKKTDSLTYFNNFNLNFDKEVKEIKYEELNINNNLNIDYNISIAVLFIVNIFQKNNYVSYYDNVYNFIKILISKGFKIYILCGVHSTFINLLKIFNILKNKNNFNNKTSRFVFYYYGHTRYINDDNLLDNYSMTAYTKENEDENLISYQQLINEIRTLNILHKWTIFETCHSSKLIKKRMTTFEIDNDKISEKSHFIISSLKEISTKGELIERIMNILNEIKDNNYYPLNLLFSKINEYSIREKEKDNVKAIMTNEYFGNFYFNESKEKPEEICGNFIEIPIKKFDYKKFSNWNNQSI